MTKSMVKFHKLGKKLCFCRRDDSEYLNALALASWVIIVKAHDRQRYNHAVELRSKMKVKESPEQSM